MNIGNILRSFGFEAFGTIADIVNLNLWDVGIIIFVILSTYIIKLILQDKYKIDKLPEWLRIPLLISIPVIILFGFYIPYTIVVLEGFRIIIKNIVFKVFLTWLTSMFLYDSMIKKIKKMLPKKKEIKKESE